MAILQLQRAPPPVKVSKNQDRYPAKRVTASSTTRSFQDALPGNLSHLHGFHSPSGILTHLFNPASEPCYLP